MRRCASLSIVFCFVTACAFAEEPQAVAPKVEPGAAISAEARRILTTMKASSYSHKTQVDEKDGVYNLDCSGLAVWVLKKTAPEALKVVPHKPGGRSLAHDFYETFNNAPAATKTDARWQKIERVMDAQPGDFIAWGKAELVKGENTGHIMLIDGKPEWTDGQVRVTVIDSTGTPHGQDTRKDGATGVGRGTIWVQVDAAGQAVSYRGSPAKGATKTMQIAIGRAH